jgi:pimeloyl-ACP methyl ester carboxylesterase
MSVHREKNVLSTKLVLKNVLRAALMIFAVIPYLFAIFTTRWVKFYETTEVRDMLNMKSRQVFFEAADGTRLSGLVIQPPYGTSKCWVIIAPGRNLTKNFFLLHARIMSDNGYNILLLDLRGNGDSSGHKYSFGVNESDDIIAAADFIYKTNPESTSHIFAFGMDEGATAVVGAAAKDKRFSGAVVAGASGYEVALPGWLSDCLPGWLKNVILKETEYVINFDIGQSVTGLEGLYEKISQISPRPVLVIDNLRNTSTDRLRAHQLYSKAKEPKMIWLTPEQTSGYQETELAGEYFAQILDLFSLGRTQSHPDS